MHLPSDVVLMIDYLAKLHDIGKIGIRDEILRKPGPLTAEEFAEIRQHPAMGATILGQIEAIGKDIAMVTHHHERYDGKGYPDGLAGEAIPLGARIIGVCDSYDAMTSHRPYRPTMTPAEALREVQRCSGTQFDPVVVKAFLRVMDPLNVGRQRD
jgi:HD-GYP domain-containing protein (c-di-GMP phosphodiesterase class II)